MREDTLNKKVYSLNNSFYEEDIEYLTYDFNLQSGDSLVVPYLDSIFVILDTVEIIKLSNGEHRKMYLFKGNDYLHYPYYIEGIGGDGGLIFPFSLLHSLGCVRKNGIDLYEPSDDIRWTCEAITTTKNLKAQYKLSIFPNPASQVLNISCKDCKLRNVEIIDVNGSLALKKQLYQIDHQQIDINYLSSGIYFIRLYDENGNYITTKFIK